MKANILTANFVNWLIDKYDHKVDLVALEVRFSKNDRRADVVCLKDVVIGYEIKGELDRLTTLKEQISDYRKCFNQMYLVTVPRHLHSARKKLPKSVGIILYDNNEFIYIRRAQNRTILSKYDVLCGININFLRRNIAYRNNCAESFRSHISENNIISCSRLIELWTEWLKNSYQNNYSYFKNNEKGKVIHSEDLSRISGKSEFIKPL